MLTSHIGNDPLSDAPIPMQEAEASARYLLSEDQFTLDHSLAVGTLAKAIASLLKLDTHMAYNVGVLHDVGKRGGCDQFEHPIRSHQLIAPFDQRCALIASYHHQFQHRIYPKQVPPIGPADKYLAEVVAFADKVDAYVMRSHTTFQAAIMRSCDEHPFNPAIVKAVSTMNLKRPLKERYGEA